MPDETVQSKAERQARLSHAMGVMFLQDKVDKLERDLSNITYSRGMHKSKSGPAAHPTTSDTPSQGRSKPRAVTESGMSTNAEASTDRASHAPKSANLIRLIDASVLIFSLRSVHNWIRDQSTCVIIPLEAINTLDLLKKGDEPINLAARKATRWLEDKIAISTQDKDAMLTHPTPGIFAQREYFRTAPLQIDKARAAAAAAGALESQDTAEQQQIHVPTNAVITTKDMFSASVAPRYLRELLSVCLYCRTAASTSVNYAVAIAYPPAHLQEKMLEEQFNTVVINDTNKCSTSSNTTSSDNNSNNKPSYLNRTDGRATEAWLDAYRIPFEVVPTSKTWTGEKPSSRFRREITRACNIESTDDPLAGSKQEWTGAQRRSTGSPTHSVSSSMSSFRSEMSNIPMLSNHQSPRHQQESRFCPVLRSGVRCMSTSASASASPMHAAVDAALATDDTRSRDSHSEDEGPFIARPSSAASSHTSFVSSLTSSTQDDRSSQTSASHCGARIVQHRPSPISSPTTATCTTDSKGSGTGASSTYTSDNAAGAKIPRLTSRSLHKTVSGAEKMEEYLKRLNRGGSGVADGRNESATPTPGSGRHG